MRYDKTGIINLDETRVEWHRTSKYILAFSQ